MYQYLNGIDHVRSQHFAMVYGDCVEELKNICYLLDMEPVIRCLKSF